MTGFERNDSVHSAPKSPLLVSFLQSAWGSDAAKIPKQASNVMDQFGQFCIGAGDGLNHLVTETSQSVQRAVSNPTKAIHDASVGGIEAVKSAAVICESGADYLSSHIAHNNLAGIAKDTKTTCDTLGAAAFRSMEHFNKLPAREKGYIFGHDVAPVAVGTVLAPELVPEGALVSGLGKAVAATGSLIKDEQMLVKAASTFNGAIERINSISDKLEAMSAKLNELRQSAEMEKRLQRAEKLYHLAGSHGDWEKIGETACSTAVKQIHDNACVAAVGHMLTDGVKTQEQLLDSMGGIWGREMLEHMAKGHKKSPQYSVEWLQHEIGWKTTRWGDHNTSVELQNLLKGHLPFGAELRGAGDGAHTVVVDGLNKATGNLLIRDSADATSYEVRTKVFLDRWTAAIFKPQI